MAGLLLDRQSPPTGMAVREVVEETKRPAVDISRRSGLPLPGQAVDFPDQEAGLPEFFPGIGKSEKGIQDGILSPRSEEVF